jgi:hypothetical protein
MLLFICFSACSVEAVRPGASRGVVDLSRMDLRARSVFRLRASVSGLAR